MTSLMSWLTPGIMHALGWTLLHFLWQGTALAALAAILMGLFSRASFRYRAAVSVLVLMIAAPIVTFLFLVPSNTSVAEKFAPVSEAQTSEFRPAVPARTGMERFPEFLGDSVRADSLRWLVRAWLVGVALLSLRSAGGFLFLARERRKHCRLVSNRILATCYALQQRLGLNRAILYYECLRVHGPAVIGWFRPVMLLPVQALTGLSEDQLRLVIAHELAHIKRLDAFVNVFQIAVETLLFYHPAVWWLNSRIRAEREHCCDEIAVSLCGNSIEYARALLLMNEWKPMPALAMAANRGPLSERVRRVLGFKSANAGARSMGMAGGLLCLSGALLAGNVLVGIAYPHPVAHAAAAIAQLSPAPLARTATPPQAAASPATSTASKPSAARPLTTEETADTADTGSYIDRMKAAGLGDVSVDELIALKIHDVTPEQVRAMRDLGLKIDAENLVAMRIHGVTPDYIREVRAAGLNPDIDQLLEMRIHGIDADYVRGLKEAGIQADIDDLVSLKIHGATPDQIRGYRQQGLQPDADNLIDMCIHGVTSDYVRNIQGLGLKPNIDDLVSMRIHDVTPEFIKALQAAGFKIDIDEVVNARIHGVTAEFIQRARAHGFKDLDIDKIIQLKDMRIMESPADL